MNLTLDSAVDFFLYPNVTMLTGINFALCLVVIWACICRLRLTSTDTLIRARAVFVFVLVVHSASAFRAPMFGSPVTTWWPLLLTTSTLFVLLINLKAWKYAPPFEMQKASSRMPLDSSH